VNQALKSLNMLSYGRGHVLEEEEEEEEEHNF